MSFTFQYSSPCDMSAESAKNAPLLYFSHSFSPLMLQFYIYFFPLTFNKTLKSKYQQTRLSAATYSEDLTGQLLALLANVC